MGVKINVSNEMNETIGKLLTNGIKYFVFDILNLTAEKKTINPILYRFKTEFLYYPIEITYVSLPDSFIWIELNIFLITKGIVDGKLIHKFGFFTGAELEDYLIFTKDDLKKVSEEIAKLFDSYAFAAHIMSWTAYAQAGMPPHLEVVGELRNDLRLYAKDIYIPPESDIFWVMYENNVKKLFGSSLMGEILLFPTIPHLNELDIFLNLLVIIGILAFPIIVGKLLIKTKLKEKKLLAYCASTTFLLLILFIPIETYILLLYVCLFYLFFSLLGIAAIVLLLIGIGKKIHIK